MKKQIFSYEKYMKNTIMQKKQLDSVKYASYKNNSFEKIKDSLKGKYEILKLKEQDLLYNYSKLNPNSIILFWEIVDRIEKDGYDKKYELIFNNLSKEIKQSFPGKILYNQFTILQENIEGNLFKFKINNTNITVSKKFTLIDFWFSHCKACLEEMPKYKSIYKKYKNNDFEIIGISTDRTNYIDDWKKVINEKDLPWLNLLDENSVEAQKYNINKFPTTFLLDKEGRIIKKDISPEELEKFLDENMKL
ncbi:TlpA family protein disulfide reductase [Chryseobacterium sp. FH2]|uniref:TlpA family protein disulfide reductase n=1 Tax=Chryseobacterium sp. FH2 TaxID=1674291 RepID=UPI001E424DF9|nr:TlpA disulfide reductase family protein [Chryseobacterium sp. FH2]